MRRNRICFVSCIIVIATVVSCGIPTSMPTLPKEVVVKAKPSVSLPLGQVNYNLYSGLHGGDMAGGTGGLNDLLGASWLQDFQEQGVAFYDYRPLDTEDDGIQKFLIHYRLDMADTLGGGGEFDLSKYQDILGDLTGKSIPIDPVSYTIPSMSMEQEILVKIDVEAVVSEIRNSINAIGSSRDSTAYLPVQEGLRELFFPYGILTDPQNANLNFSITLPNLEYLTLTDGTIEFEFTLKYGSFSQLLAGSSLTLSDFELRADEQSGSIEKVKPQQQSVDLLSDGAKGTLSIKFEEGAKLPQQFDLVCKLSITGKFANPAFAQGYFELTIRPDFKDYTISGVQNLELLESQIASLSSELRMDPYSISESLSPSFSATVGEGTLEIDTGELFPPLPLGGQESGAEGWNIMLDLSDLYIKQDPLSDVPGLSMGKTNGQAPLSPNNSLKDKKLNSAPVQVGGKVTASLPESKLTFCNFPGGIAKEGPVSYGKKVYVRMNVSLLSEVKVEPEDFGLGDLAKGLNPEEQELGDDFAAFTAWLNYIQFPGWTEESPDRGLGVRLEIGKLNMADGLGLFITVNGFGMDNIFQPLKNLTDPAGHPKDEARLIFLRGSKESPGAYKLMGDEIPEKLSVSVQLGLENPEDQKTYEETGILTMQNVVPGKPIEVTGAEAYLIFDWIEMSIKPRPPANEEGAENSMPDYPFAGTFPDNETGIDLSGIPQGLGFYIPPDEEAGEGLSSRLYINLKRKTLNKETGDWEEEPPDDPESSDYDEHDPGGWGRNLQVNLPNLDFRVRYGDGTVSDNLFSYEPGLRVGTGSWTLSRPIGEIMEDPELGLIADDVENGDNPFKIYAGSSLPEQDKAIPLGNLAKALNEALTGRKKGPLFFTYTVELADVSGEAEGTREPGELLLYPAMLEKKIAASADLLIVLPLAFEADPHAKEPVALTIDPGGGNGDLFGRAGPEDNGFFDQIGSLGFSLAVKNMAGLRAGTLFLQNKTDVKKLRYRLPVVNFDPAGPPGSFSLGSEDIEQIKAIWPFVLQASLEFKAGDIVRIERNFNIELQGLTIKAGGEYAFETGL